MDGPSPFLCEWDAYTVLENTHHSLSPAPRCHGSITPMNISGLLDTFSGLSMQQKESLKATHFGQLGDTPEEKGRGLIIEYIPNTQSVFNKPTFITPEVVELVKNGLEDLHRRGVVHGDPAPRNLLIAEDGRVVWVDDDRAVCSRYWEFDTHFSTDFRTLEDEVVGTMKQPLERWNTISKCNRE